MGSTYLIPQLQKKQHWLTSHNRCPSLSIGQHHQKPYRPLLPSKFRQILRLTSTASSSKQSLQQPSYLSQVGRVHFCGPQVILSGNSVIIKLFSHVSLQLLSWSVHKIPLFFSTKYDSVINNDHGRLLGFFPGKCFNRNFITYHHLSLIHSSSHST